MIAVDDIGKFGAQAFIDADSTENGEVDIAGDAVTMPEAAAAVERAGRQDAHLSSRSRSRRSARTARTSRMMLEWFESTGYSADIASLEKRFGIRPLTLPEWVRKGQR